MVQGSSVRATALGAVLGGAVGAVVGAVVVGVGVSVVLAAAGFLAGGDEGFGQADARRADVLLLVATLVGAVVSSAVGAVLMGSARRRRLGPGVGAGGPGAPPP
ncbi:MAG: hypothetical protein IPM45_05525 [Acidimicrobiales bacterium]|nr:hypothetical protein [Acidimicrobiales bacterium]